MARVLVWRECSCGAVLVWHSARVARAPSPANRRLMASAESALPLAYPKSPVSSASTAISAVKCFFRRYDLWPLGLPFAYPKSPVSSASTAISAVNVSSDAMTSG